MLRVLEELSEGKEGGVVLAFMNQPLKFEAVFLLAEHGALVDKERTSYYRVTISGYDYYQKLKTPRVYWAKKNWFPVGVLIVSSLVPVVSSLIVVLLR